MHIPKETTPARASFAASSDVYLEAGHICIKREPAEKVFGSEKVVLSVFYSKESLFMAAPAGEELFKAIHKAAQQMLKTKNMAGDKSISIQELLLDHDIEGRDRDLSFVIEEALHILKVTL